MERKTGPRERQEEWVVSPSLPELGFRVTQVRRTLLILTCNFFFFFFNGARDGTWLHPQQLVLTYRCQEFNVFKSWKQMAHWVKCGTPNHPHRNYVFVICILGVRPGLGVPQVWVYNWMNWDHVFFLEFGAPNVPPYQSLTKFYPIPANEAVSPAGGDQAWESIQGRAN